LTRASIRSAQPLSGLSHFVRYRLVSSSPPFLGEQLLSPALEPEHDHVFLELGDDGEYAANHLRGRRVVNEVLRARSRDQLDVEVAQHLVAGQRHYGIAAQSVMRWLW